jgi:hypothetical protein
MNTINTFKNLLALMPVAGMALAASSPAAFAQQGTSSASSSGKLSIVASESIDSDDANGDGNVKAESFEIRIEDGKVSVRHNGKDVPDAQVVQKDGHVVILTDDGKELRAIKMFQGGGPGGYFYHMGEGGQIFGVARAFTGGPIEGGEVPAPPKVMLGVHMGQPGPALEKHLRLDSGACTMITGVLEGLPADEAGIGEFDIIIAIDGEKPADAATIRTALDAKDDGDTVTLRIIQEGDEKDVKVKVQAYDAEKMQKAKLLGMGPEAAPLHAMDPLGVDLEQLRGRFQDWKLQMPERFEGQVFVAPEIMEWKGLMDVYPKLEGMQGELKDLQPMIEKQLHDALRKYGEMHGGDDADAGDSRKVEAQLDRLDQRLTELERLLEKLVEKQAKP